MRTAYGTGHSPHISLFYPFGVSCSHCKGMLVCRKADGASLAPTRSVLVQRDVTVSWEVAQCPQLGQERLFKPRNAGVFPQETEALCGWFLLSLATQSPGICWSWFQQTCWEESSPASKGGVGRCATRASCACIVPSSSHSARNYFLWGTGKQARPLPSTENILPALKSLLPVSSQGG